MSYRHGAGGLGADPALITVTATAAQQQLRRAGFNIGSAGVDGHWGASTDSALRAAFTYLRTVVHQAPSGVYRVVSGGVEMPVGDWVMIQTIPTGAGGYVAAGGSAPPQTTPHPAVLQPSTTPPVMLPATEEDGGGTNLTPWIVGGAVLAAIGAYFYFSAPAPKKAVKANRRRRARRNARKPWRTFGAHAHKWTVVAPTNTEPRWRYECSVCGKLKPRQRRVAGAPK